VTTIRLTNNLTLAKIVQGEVRQLGLSHVALRQGSLDGACGPYSLMMALVISGALRFDEAIGVWSRRPHGNSMLAREQEKLGALIQNGTSAEDLALLFEAIKRSLFPSHLDDLRLELVDDDRSMLSGVDLLRAICGHIDAAQTPVILGLNWAERDGGGAHWVVVVGYEGDERAIHHLVLLDPGAETETTGLWNAVLTGPVQRGKRAYLVWNNRQEPRQCSVGIALAIKGNMAGASN